MLRMTKDYLTGIEEIDKQHRILFKFVNILEREIESGETKKTLQKAIAFMENYTYEHFGFEEMCMYGYKCPETTKNKLEHEKFIKQLKKYNAKSQKKGYTKELIAEIHQFSESWLKSHILDVDSKLKKCLRKKTSVK